MTMSFLTEVGSQEICNIFQKHKIGPQMQKTL